MDTTAMAGGGHHPHHSSHHQIHAHQQQRHGSGTALETATHYGGTSAPLGCASLPFVAAPQAGCDVWGEESWIVDCPCGVTFDDGEEMVECDSCCVWVHTSCCRVPKGLSTYVCDKCKSKKKSEDEVVQLLVDFPNTARTGSADVKANGKTLDGGGRVFTSTDVPIEQRVHVQGIPGGDSKIFMGVSKILRQLWQHSGYVPKTFQVEYDEFPDRGKSEDETCLFVLKSAADKVDDMPLETGTKPEQSSLAVVRVSEKESDRSTENLLLEVHSFKRELEEKLESRGPDSVRQTKHKQDMLLQLHSSKKGPEEKIESKELDCVRQRKHKQRLRGIKDNRADQHSKQGRDVSLLNDQTTKKKTKCNPDICKSNIDIDEYLTSAPQQLSPKNPKAMKKSAVQEFMDFGTITCSKCRKYESVTSVGSIEKGAVPHDSGKSIVCKECEHASDSLAEEHSSDVLLQKTVEKVQSVSFPSVTDSASILNKPEIADAKLQDINDAADQHEASMVGENRGRGDQGKCEPVMEGLSGETHLPGGNAEGEEKDHKNGIINRKLEGQQPFTKSKESICPLAVLNTQASFSGAKFEEKPIIPPMLSRQASESLAEPMDSEVFSRSVSETPLEDSSKLQEHELAVPLSTVASSNAFPDSQLEDVLQPLPSAVSEKQHTSRITKDRNEESSKSSGHKYVLKEQSPQQPRNSEVEPHQPHDFLQFETIEGKQQPAKSLDPSPQQHLELHVQEGLAGILPHGGLTEDLKPSKDEQDVLRQRTSNLPLHSEMNASPLQSTKIHVQKLTKPAQGSKSSALAVPPKLSAAKSSVASSVSQEITKNTKQPVRVGSPPLRRADNLSLPSLKSSSGVSPGGCPVSAHLSKDGMKPSVCEAGKTSMRKTVSHVKDSKLPVSIPKAVFTPSISRTSAFQLSAKKIPSNVSSPKPTVVVSGKPKLDQLNKEENLDSRLKVEKTNLSSAIPSFKPLPSLDPSPPCVTIPHLSATASTSSPLLNDEEELNSSPRVPRVPRVRQIISSPQRVLSNQPLSGVVKGVACATPSSSGSKDSRPTWRKKIRDERHKDGCIQTGVVDESNKTCDPTSSALPNKKEEEGSVVAGELASAETCEETDVFTMAGPPQQSASVGCARNSPTVESTHLNLSGERKNAAEFPNNFSGLVCELLSSKEAHLSFEDLCTATLPHWQKLRRSNSEPYAHLSHRQALLDCLRNSIEWAHLVDQAPKMMMSKRKHRNDSSSTTEVESEEDADLGSSYTHDFLEFRRPGKLSRTNEGEKVSIDKKKHHEKIIDDVPKGKRKARRRRKLAIEDETEDDEEYIEKPPKPPLKKVFQGKVGGCLGEEQEAPYLSEAASSHPSEDEEEEIVVHRGVRRNRKQIEGNSSEDDS